MAKHNWFVWTLAILSFFAGFDLFLGAFNFNLLGFLGPTWDNLGMGILGAAVVIVVFRKIIRMGR